MKSTPIFNQLPSATSKKYIPTPEAAELILNYFIYNNFQDFNTWQQIAKTKVEYEYSESNKAIFGCRVTLKWEDRTLPTIIQSSDARSKRSAKKRALKKLVESIVNYGYIALGFREDNFVQKLPRRRKNDSDQSDEELEEEKYEGKMGLVQMMLSGRNNDVFQILIRENQKWKIPEVMECWKFGLSKKSIPFLRNALRAYYKKELTSMQDHNIIDENHHYSDEILLPRQISLGKMVKDPLREDLTDFIRYCQLQKSTAKPRELIRKPVLQSQPIPSEFVISQVQTALSNSFPPSPTMQQLIKYFHPIEGRKIFLSNMRRLSQNYIEQIGIQLPKFENQYRQMPLKLAQQLYGLLPYFSKDYGFIQKVIQMMSQQLSQIEIQFETSIELKYQQKGVEYYRRSKNLLTAQFCYLLYSKISNLGSNVCLEGMIVSLKTGENVFLFNCKEPQEIVVRKINRRSNMSEFEEISQISMNQFVLLVCKVDKSVVFIGQIIELMPNIKIYIPELDDSNCDPMPFIITRIYNSKIFEKTSASISKISKHCMKLFDQNTTILWQPPSYPIFSLLAQLLIQWQIMKATVLVISLDADALHTELTSLGFKSVKITQKTEEKLLVKCNVVVSMPSAVCCQLLKNYAFQRVVIEGAHQISEISSLSALVKGCKQLYLIGDPFMPRMQVSSPYCIKNGMGTSLLQRLYHDGHKTQTFFSRYEDSREYRNIMQWADRYIYNRQLKLMEKEMLTPIIKGFPWPSIDYRVCYVHHKYEGVTEQIYLEQQAFLCSLICGEVVKSGYTKVQHITCSTGTRKNLPFLQKYMTILLRKLNHNDIKLFTKLINRLCRLVTGSIYFRSELSILMLGTDQPSLSFREIIAALREGRRGVILIGDMNNSARNPDFSNFIDWCKDHKLICSVDQSQMIHLS